MEFKNNKLNDSFQKYKTYFKKHKDKYKKVALICFLGSLFLSSYLNQHFLEATGQIIAAYYSPINIIYYGIIYNPILLVFFFGLSTCVIFYRMYYLDTQDRYTDEDGVTISDTKEYGKMHMMRENEFNETFEVHDSIEDSTLDIAGIDKTTKKTVFTKENETDPHEIIIGTSGSGKTAGEYFNKAIQIFRRGQSIVFTDPKGEFVKLLKRIAEKEFKIQTFEFNINQPILSDGINVLKYIRSYSDVRKFVEIIMKNTEDSTTHKEDFWYKGEKSLIAFAILYVIETLEKPTLRDVHNFLIENNNIKNLDKIAASLKRFSNAKKAYAVFKSSPENAIGGIITGSLTRLDFLNDPAIETILSEDEIDLKEIGRKQTALFVVMNDHDSSNQVVSALFFTLITSILTDEADSRLSQTLKVPTYFLMDELPSIGLLPDLPNYLATLRSRDMHFILGVQDLGKLEDMYPGKIYLNILGNCGTWIITGVLDATFTGKILEAASGIETIEVESTREERSRFLPYTYHPSVNTSVAKGQRGVLPAAEFRLLKHDMIIMKAYHNPIKLDKPYYFLYSPWYKKIEKELPIEHEPQWWNKMYSKIKNNDESALWFKKELNHINELKLRLEVESLEEQEEENLAQEEIIEEVYTDNTSEKNNFTNNIKSFISNGLSINKKMIQAAEDKITKLNHDTQVTTSVISKDVIKTEKKNNLFSEESHSDEVKKELKYKTNEPITILKTDTLDFSPKDLSKDKSIKPKIENKSQSKETKLNSLKNKRVKYVKPKNL